MLGHRSLRRRRAWLYERTDSRHVSKSLGRGAQDHLLHVRLPLRHQRAHEGRAKVAYIEGNRDHPVNKGVLCAKGSAGIMQHLSPSRLRAPMKRVGPRGSGEFEEISWDEALEIAAGWLKPLRETDQSEAGILHRARPVAKLHLLLGAKPSARRTMRRMAASARSTWRPQASTPWAVHSGSSVSPTGTAPSCS